MHSYSAFGLNLNSELYLPELGAESTGAPDVTIRLGHLQPFQPNVPGRNHRADSRQICLYYEKVGRFRIRCGREIVVDPEPGADTGLVRLCLVGPSLAAVLHQRRLLVLHGSAIELDGMAIAFLGDKGWGKSTIAAYMQSRGHRFLADDLVAVETSPPSDARLVPGLTQVKLWPDTVSYLGLDIEKMICLQPELAKRGHTLNSGCSASPLCFSCIYILDLGERTRIDRIEARPALMELVRHSYLARFLQATDTAQIHLDHCFRVVRDVPICTLRRPPSLMRLPEVARLVEGHASRAALQPVSCSDPQQRVTLP